MKKMSKDLDSYDVLLSVIYHINPESASKVGEILHITKEELGFILRVFKDHPYIKSKVKDKEYIRKEIENLFEGTIYKDKILSEIIPYI